MLVYSQDYSHHPTTELSLLLASTHQDMLLRLSVNVPYMSVILQCFITLKAPDALVNLKLNKAKPSCVQFILKSHSPACYFTGVCASRPKQEVCTGAGDTDAFQLIIILALSLSQCGLVPGKSRVDELREAEGTGTGDKVYFVKGQTQPLVDSIIGATDGFLRKSF